MKKNTSRINSYLFALSRSLLAVFVFIFSLSVANAAEKALIAKGKALSSSCIACHGVDGNSVSPAFPKIAGQHESYLIKQMTNLKAHDKRENVLMEAPMIAVSADEIRALAAYYSSQTLLPEKAKHPEWKDMAEKLWRSGFASRGMAACASCHGPAGRGIPDQYPSIAGQYAQYLKVQLEHFRSEERSNDPEGIMRANAKLLTNPEIDALADYISGLRLTK